MARAHDPSKEQFWRQALARFRASNLTIRDFCVHEHLSEASFYAWRAELARRDQTRRRQAVRTDRGRGESPRRCGPAFVPVDVIADDSLPSADSGIDVVCRGGRVIRVRAGFDAATLREAITVLELLPC